MLREMLSWAGALPEGTAYYLRHRKAVRELQWNRDMIDLALEDLDADFQQDRLDRDPNPFTEADNG